MVAALVAGSYLVGRQVRDLFQVKPVSSGDRTVQNRTPMSVGSGPQLVMIYFGSASCAWSNSPATSALVHQARLALAEKAQTVGTSFTAIGVALDWKVAEGLEHLMRVDTFDQVISGGNWANDLALRTFGAARNEPMSTPLILVLKRNLVVPDFRGDFAYRFTSEHIVAQVAGIRELRRWVANGLPLVDRAVVARVEQS